MGYGEFVFSEQKGGLACCWSIKNPEVTEPVNQTFYLVKCHPGISWPFLARRQLVFTGGQSFWIDLLGWSNMAGKIILTFDQFDGCLVVKPLPSCFYDFPIWKETKLRQLTYSRNTSNIMHLMQNDSHMLLQYNTTQHNTTQYNTMQCNAMQYNTIQCNTVQHNTMQCNAILTIVLLTTPKKAILG